MVARVALAECTCFRRQKFGPNTLLKWCRCSQGVLSRIEASRYQKQSLAADDLRLVIQLRRITGRTETITRAGHHILCATRSLNMTARPGNEKCEEALLSQQGSKRLLDPGRHRTILNCHIRTRMLCSRDRLSIQYVE